MSLTQDREKYQEMLEEARRLRALMASDGWQALTSLLEEQLAQTHILLSAPYQNPGDEYRKEYTAGQVQSLMYVLKLPEYQLEANEAAMDSLLQRYSREELEEHGG